MFNVKAVGLICMLALVVGLAGCKFYETDKANKLVDAANASIKDANDRADKGTNRLQELETGALQAEAFSLAQPDGSAGWHVMELRAESA